EADRKVIPAPSALWHAVVGSIYQSALHDTTDFWREETFKRVYRPLAHQLPNTKAEGSSEQAHALYVERVSKCLAPAIGQLAAAAGNDALWKMINQEVMLKSRSDVPSVRVASLVVLQALYGKLGEEFLILLPETIPFLAELLEDDNGLVERATQETVKVIESHLGESLQSYLR
ncbi:snoRNA-binding rRNA-processing protein utp10, partial [Coemansia sp. S85]